MRTAWKASLVLAAVVSLVGCTSSEQDSPERARSTPSVGAAAEASPPANENASAERPCAAGDIEVSGQPRQAPEITIPDDCGPPNELISEDVSQGNGPAVRAGDRVSMHYSLVTWSDKQEKDSSWSRGQPLEVRSIGSGEVIPGWDEGLIGMKQGARRLLVVPPEKGYGEQGQGEIKPNETLVFVVDAVQVG
ncbi:MAG: FKBP-type peptidyl-prolyl cis-trans isomerase [Pseudonocardiaceae bacterium]|nr:FKBP-type peptidyl-prolyl cis-trans isomerase [Pseudonocardiaceae bacterium]